MDNLQTYSVEVTDTFNGEANYCWVRRYTVRARNDAGAVRAAKRAAEWNGWRCNREDYSDTIELRPRDGACVVMFITPGER